MIEALRDDDIIEKVGGRFKLTSMIQRRWLELMRGAQPLVPTVGRTPMEVVIEEIMQDKININYESSSIATPDIFLK